MADMRFDCTPLEASKFAYTCDIIRCIKLLDNRKRKGRNCECKSGRNAGKDWYRGFMNHLKTLSVQTPEGTRL